jgi:beta-xylosidase
VDYLTWADNYAWAPDCAYKDGKYYFCFPAGTGMKDRVNPKNSTKWMGIGIAVSDSPTGPLVDKALKKCVILPSFNPAGMMNTKVRQNINI